MNLLRRPFERKLALLGYAAIAGSIVLLAVGVVRFGTAWQAHPILLWTSGALFISGVALRLSSEMIRFRNASRAVGSPPDPKAERPLIGPDTFPPEGPVL